MQAKCTQKMRKKIAQEIAHAACDTVEPLQDLLKFKADRKMDLRVLN